MSHIPYHPPFAPPPPAGLPPAWHAWALQIVHTLGLVLEGKQNNTTERTALAANAAATTLRDARISATSAILPMPLTASAAAELAAGGMYVSTQQAGQATVAHANNPSTDRQFRFLIVG